MASNYLRWANASDYTIPTRADKENYERRKGSFHLEKLPREINIAHCETPDGLIRDKAYQSVRSLSFFAIMHFEMPELCCPLCTLVLLIEHPDRVISVKDEETA